jgi:Cdc6-like AAA superfamily ATPase
LSEEPLSYISDVERELRHFHTIPFIYGYRGVGKTSLARTAAQIATSSDREHIYVACAPGAKIYHIFREIGGQLLNLISKHQAFDSIRKKVELEISLNPKIRTSAENVHELIGAHQSVPRYLKEVSHQPLLPQHLMDIVTGAASAIDAGVPRDILYSYRNYC